MAIFVYRCLACQRTFKEPDPLDEDDRDCPRCLARGGIRFVETR